MKRLLIIIIVLLSAVACFSQNAKREGIIRTYQEQKAIRTRDIYIQHLYSKDSIQIKTSTYSDYEGHFTIVFPPKIPYPTSITVKFNRNEDFKNYEVVNTYDINNIKSTDKEILVLIGNKSTINKQKELFYEVITDPIKKQYNDSISQLERKISNLRKQEKNYEDSIKILNQKIENLKKELSDKEQRNKELSEQLEQTRLELIMLRENPLILGNETYENNSRLLIEAFGYFSKGEIEKARQCIPKNYDEGANLTKKENKLYFSLYQIDAMIDEADGKLDSAVVKYNKSLDHIIHDERYKLFSTYMNIAELEYILKQHNEAIVNLNTALKVDVNVIYKIRTYNLWAKILQSQKNKDFHKKYKEAIDLYETFKKGVLIESIPIADKEVAISYTQLANYYRGKKQYYNAENNYQKAFDIYILMKSSGIIDAENQINMLFNFAIFYVQQSKRNLANQCRDRIDLLLKKISPEKRIEFYELQGDLSLMTDIASSKTHYQELIEIYTQKDSILYESQIININLKIAISNEYSGNPDTMLLRNLIDKIDRYESKLYQRQKSIALALLGAAYKHKAIKNMEMSKRYFKDAKEIANYSNDKELYDFIYQIKNKKLLLMIDNNLLLWAIKYPGYIGIFTLMICTILL